MKTSNEINEETLIELFVIETNVSQSHTYIARPKILWRYIMGWIHERKWKTGHGINTTGRNGSHNGPLRKVVLPLLFENYSLFHSKQKSLLECGHEIWHSYGSDRARCYLCKQENEKEKT